MTTLAEWMQIYRILVRSTLKTRVAYRWNFLFSLAFQMLTYFAELAAVLLIIGRVGSLAGWGTYDIMMLFGLMTTSTGIYRIFASELHDFDKYLVNGDFDAVLVRPAPTLVIIAARSIDVEQAGPLIQGVGVLVFVYWKLAPTFHFGLITVLEILLSVLCGAVIWFSIVTATATLGFWTTRVDDIQSVTMYGPATASSYPLSIYPKAIQAVFYSILPIAFASYIPANVMLHKGLPAFTLVYCATISLICITAAVWFWNCGVRRYTGTGT